jgi:hypothetical protein
LVKSRAKLKGIEILGGEIRMKLNKLKTNDSFVKGAELWG